MQPGSRYVCASIAALVLVASCGDRSLQGVSKESVAGTVGGERAQSLDMARRMGAPARPEVSPAPALVDVVTTSASEPPNIPVVPRAQSTAAPSMIIRNGDVTIQVDSVQRAIEAVRRVAASVGGYVGNVRMETGEHQVRSATLEMKVPAARFDDAMTGVRPIGEVESSNASAEDVGEEFVDVSARIANGRRLEERLVRLLDTRTGKLVDVLAIERELARVREEIERYEGRIRYLSARIATSSIAVTVHEKPPIVAQAPGSNPIRLEVIGMWRNMVRVVAVGIEMLGVIVPPLALALIGVLVWRRARRRAITAFSAGQ